VRGAMRAQVISDGERVVDQHRVLCDLLDHGDDVGFLVSELAQASDAWARMQVSRLTCRRRRASEWSRSKPRKLLEGVDTAGPGGDVDYAGRPLMRA